MSQLTTPISTIERYFDLRLDRAALKRFDETSDEQWIDFAKHYLAVMETDFPAQFLHLPEGADPSVRLYFEPRISHAWDAAVTALHQPTPLLGLSPHPRAGTITRDDVSTMLRPLKKHFLLADSVYLRDSFYYCFDAVADSVDRTSWRRDPNTANLVHSSIQSIKQWLPILIELRDLIESKALVFMPYYITPSFPYAGDAPNLKPYFQKLKVRPRSNSVAMRDSSLGFDLNMLADPDYSKRMYESSTQDRDYFDETEVIGAWLNARILHLDPVFPNRAMFNWAANLYFDDGPEAQDLTTDLISLDVLPFGGAEGIAIDDLLSMRKNEEVFRQVQRVVASCKDYIEVNLGPTSTRDGVSAACKSFLHDELEEYERRSVLKFIDENLMAGIGFSLVVGVALLTAQPAVGVIAGALLTPGVFRVIQRGLDPKRRAIGRLQALL
jgi:hypothetical protein